MVYARDKHLKRTNKSALRSRVLCAPFAGIVCHTLVASSVRGACDVLVRVLVVSVLVSEVFIQRDTHSTHLNTIGSLLCPGHRLFTTLNIIRNACANTNIIHTPQHNTAYTQTGALMTLLSCACDRTRVPFRPNDSLLLVCAVFFVAAAAADMSSHMCIWQSRTAARRELRDSFFRSRCSIPCA